MNITNKYVTRHNKFGIPTFEMTKFDVSRYVVVRWI